MISTVRTAITAALVCLAATAHAAEGELWFRKAEKVALARGIQRDGFPCAEIKAVYFVGARAEGNHLRAVCGTAEDSAAPSSFRLTVRGSGSYRVEPWNEKGGAFATMAGLGAGFMLRASLD